MARVVLLCGASGSGKSRLARRSGLPVLALDDFFRDADDPALPRGRDGAPAWDDPAAWHRDHALAAIEALSRVGRIEVPRYEFRQDRAVGRRVVYLGDARVVLAEGLFAALLVTACREHGLLADALCLRRRPAATFVRRLLRDLHEHRKPPLVVVRRSIRLLRTEDALVAEAVAQGARPVTASEARAALDRAAGRDGSATALRAARRTRA